MTTETTSEARSRPWTEIEHERLATPVVAPEPAAGTTADVGATRLASRIRQRLPTVRRRRVAMGIAALASTGAIAVVLFALVTRRLVIVIARVDGDPAS